MIQTEYFKRLLDIRSDKSFFLWGPRQSGKSMFLQHNFSDAFYVDLLLSENFTRYTNRPELLRAEIDKSKPKLVVIDEIQKIPSLLDEIHWLIENTRTRFALCGSSARKLKRGAANLLGGRALRYEMFGFVSKELEQKFDLTRALNFGYLPSIYLDLEPNDLLASYVSDYLKEEIADEGLVRNLPPFSDFLRSAALCDTEIVNYTNIASDCGVSRDTVINYYSILTETHLGRFIPAYTNRPKRKIVRSPKYYLFDVGIVNYLAKRGEVKQGSELYGKAFENWVCHELSAYLSYSRLNLELSYWKLNSGHEVDFIIGDMLCAIEVKSTKTVTNRHLKGMRELKKDHPEVKRRIVVSCELRSRTENEIDILTADDFVAELWSGRLM